MQNAFDSLIGDVAIDFDDRYLIVEFKRDREGFAVEVGGTTAGKKNRAALYAHLLADDKCYGLSRLGHYGAYLDNNSMIRLQRYAHCPAGLQTEQGIFDKAIAKTGSLHPMDAFDTERHVEEIYKLLMKGRFNEDGTPWQEEQPNRHIEGTGLTYEQLQEYVNCMYRHLQSNDDSLAAIIRIKKGKGFFVIGTTIDLVNLLRSHFDAAYNVTPTSTPPAPPGTQN